MSEKPREVPDEINVGKDSDRKIPEATTGGFEVFPIEEKLSPEILESQEAKRPRKIVLELSVGGYSQFEKRDQSEGFLLPYYSVPLPVLETDDIYIPSDIALKGEGRNKTVDFFNKEKIGEVSTNPIAIEAAHIPLADHSVNVLVYPSTFGTPTIQDKKKEEFGVEAARVIEPHGRVIVTEYSGEAMSSDGVMKLFRKNGFRLKNCYIKPKSLMMYEKFWLDFEQEGKSSEVSLSEIPDLSTETIEGLEISKYKQLRKAGMLPTEIHKAFGGYHRQLQMAFHDALSFTLGELESKKVPDEKVFYLKNECIEVLQKTIEFGVQDDLVTKEDLESMLALAEESNWFNYKDVLKILRNYVEINRRVEKGIASNHDEAVKALKELGFYDYEQFEGRSLEEWQQKINSKNKKKE